MGQKCSEAIYFMYNCAPGKRGKTEQLLKSSEFGNFKEIFTSFFEEKFAFLKNFLSPGGQKQAKK